MTNGNGINQVNMAKAKNKSASEGTQEVNGYMQLLQHPLKKEIQLVRAIILESDPTILEQVKWNAPSFRCTQDFVTFNVRPTDKIHLVFHHPSIVQIKSELLEGEYKDRRMLYVKDGAEIDASKSELQRIIHQSVKLIAAENQRVSTG
jgi:hypothetical protein